MRGKKAGFETQAKKDTLSIVSNAAEELVSLFRSEVEDFCFDVYYDIET